MKLLSIDIETFSSYDLPDCGVYRYAEAPDFAILLFACSVDGGPVEVTDLACGEELPPDILSALTDGKVLKTAWNAAFERTCIARHTGLPLPAQQWECTMVRALYAGLPAGLDQAAAALGTGAQKMREGKALIRYFSMPCKPTKANGMRARNLPEHDPEKWETFKEYCAADVRAENRLRDALGDVTIPGGERKLYILDQAINDRGVCADMHLADKAARMSHVHTGLLMAEAGEITGLDNPNSVMQLKKWFNGKLGEEVETLNREALDGIDVTDGAVARVVELRRELGKTSVKKYEALQSAVCRDGRVRGLLQFYGANRTGRWAGRLVQLQNLPRNYLPDLDTARRAVLDGDREIVETLYGDVPGTLSQLTRTAFTAPAGHTLAICDFSAIEARVVAWLSGERWRLEVFQTHGKIYEASAAMMFRVPIEEITKTDPRRQKGKIAELALGYGGGVAALRAMGAERIGLTDAEMQGIVQDWREANPRIVGMWKAAETAATRAIRGAKCRIGESLAMRCENGALTVELPSGRKLYYRNAQVVRSVKFGRETDAVIYQGLNQTTHRWESQETYGGRLVENIVQAIARDCLACALLEAERSGIRCVFHVHDEIAAEVPEEEAEEALERLRRIFAASPEWAPGLPLKGDGFISKYYKKE